MAPVMQVRRLCGVSNRIWAWREQMMNGMGGMMATCVGGMSSLLAFFGVLWVAMVAALVYLARRLWHRPQLATPHGAADDAALRTLRERFARGEIDRAEYEERRQTLTEGRHWP